MTLDLATVRLTRQKVNTGIWICAALTMTASAISGVTAFYYLQKDGWGIASGAMTALTVDVALWVVLTGDRLMEAIGITAGPWARVVRWGTAIMSVTLNVTAAAVADIPTALKVPLIILHAFVPLVMVALAELRGEYAAQLAPAERAALTEIEAQERATDTPVVATSERISPAALQLQPPDPTVTPFALRPEHVDGQSARPRADQRKRTRSSRGQRPDLRVSTPPAARRSNVRETAFEWLDANHGPGTTARKLAEGIGGSDHTCKKLLGEWRRQKAAS
jgi:hypothetical protein